MSASTSSKLVVAVLIAAQLSGCAWWQSGSSQEVTFTSDPEGAEFQVGEIKGVTPQTVLLPKDDYQVLFSKPGYLDSTYDLKRRTNGWFYWSIAMGLIASVVDLATGSWKEFEFDKVHVVLTPGTEKPPDLITVRITSVPPGARVFIEDVEAGVTPLQYAVPWRTRDKEKTASFRLAGHDPKAVRFLRQDGEISARLDATPERVIAKFESTPPGAEVRVDGKPAGTTPLQAEFIWLPDSAPRRVEFTKAGYRAETRELRRGDTDLSAALTETVETLPLRVRIDPADATVEVNEQIVDVRDGKIPVEWSISRRRHTLRISQPGYATKVRVVTREDAEGAIDVSLMPYLPKSP